MKKILKAIASVMVCVCIMTFLDVTAFAASSLSKPTVKISVADTENPTIKLSWKEVSGANKYYIYRSDTKDGSLKLTAKTSKLYYNDKSLSLDKTYYYKVKAVTVKNGTITAKSSYSSLVSKAVVDLAATSSITATAKSDSSIKVSYKAVSGADRYYVYYSTSKNGTYKSAKTTKTSCTIKNLEPNTTYYFKVKAAKVIDGKVYKGDVSSIVSKKTEKGENEYVVKITPVSTSRDTDSFVASLAMLGKNGGLPIGIDEYFESIYDLNYFNGSGYGSLSVELSTGKLPSGYSNALKTQAVELTFNYSTFSLGFKPVTVKDGFTSSNGYKKIKETLDNGNIILVGMENTAATKETNWWTISSDGEKSVNLSDSYEYGVLCGYTNSDYIVFNPETYKYEKYSIKSELDLIKAMIFFDMK